MSPFLFSYSYCTAGNVNFSLRLIKYLYVMLYSDTLTSTHVLFVSIIITVGCLSVKHWYEVLFLFRTFEAEDKTCMKILYCDHMNDSACMSLSGGWYLPLDPSRAKNSLVFTASWMHPKWPSGRSSFKNTQHSIITPGISKLLFCYLLSLFLLDITKQIYKYMTRNIIFARTNCLLLQCWPLTSLQTNKSILYYELGTRL